MGKLAPLAITEFLQFGDQRVPTDVRVHLHLFRAFHQLRIVWILVNEITLPSCPHRFGSYLLRYYHVYLTITFACLSRLALSDWPYTVVDSTKGL